MDVINFISKNTALPDGATIGTGGLGDGFPHYGTGPRVHEFVQEMRREVFEGRDGKFLTVGEMPGVTWEDARLFTDPARGELDMVFQFEHVSLDHGPGGKFDPKPLDLRDLKASLGRWQTALADTGWNSLYWNNHDQPRVVSRFGDDDRWWRESATALATVLHLHRGTPYVYQGEELGMTNAPFADVADFRDVESLNYFRRSVDAGQDPEVVLRALRIMSRDNARTPMQWDDSPNAGFTKGEPWIEVNPNSAWLNAEAQRDDPKSVFHHYRSLIDLRHTRPVVALGDFRMLLADHPHVYAYERTLDDARLLVIANLSGTDQTCDVDPEWSGAELVLTNTAPVDIRDGRMTLGPWAALVFEG
jgi:oligo-1,6-glucosidase